MQIPDDIKIPVMVFALQAALLLGTGMVFMVLIPHW